MHDLQRLAADVTREVLAGKSLTAELARLWPGCANLSPQQRAQVQDACYGVLRSLGTLEAILSQLVESSRGNALKPLLLVALYQLRQTRVPHHAVVDNAVRAAAPNGPGPAGFVNAVLRNYLRRRALLETQAKASPRGRFSYPEWWIAGVRASYPRDYADILDAGNVRPPFTLRVNRRKLDREAYLALLRQYGIEATAVGELGVTLAQPRRVADVPLFAEGAVSVQDLGAQLAAPLLDLAPGHRVLDACAAPGGKTGHILELAEVQLCSVDSDALRLGRVAENLARLRLSGHLVEGDAATPERWWDGKLFDRILADVPCTASGVVRRHPDIKWLRRQSDIADFAAQQARILRALWSCLKPGGKLLYTTCSLFTEENEAQIAAFCATRPDAQRLPAALAGESSQLLPSAADAAHNHDGFFYALLAKTT